MKYGNLTLVQIEALLNKVGGVEAVMAVLRGERTLVVEEATRSVVASPPASLIGTVVKTLRLAPYAAASVADAIALGRYDSVDDSIVRQFADDEIGLTAGVSVDLVQFDRDPFRKEMLAWGKANAKSPISPKHILAIGAQHPDEQRNAPIVALGSARGGRVLCLRGDSDWRDLYRGTVEGRWRRYCLFGFLSE